MTPYTHEYEDLSFSRHRRQKTLISLQNSASAASNFPVHHINAFNLLPFIGKQQEKNTSKKFLYLKQQIDANHQTEKDHNNTQNHRSMGSDEIKAFMEPVKNAPVANNGHHLHHYRKER